MTRRQTAQGCCASGTPPPTTPPSLGSSTTRTPGSISFSFICTCLLPTSFALELEKQWQQKHHDIRFAYVRTDSEGKASYTYTRSSNGQSQNYYLHYYDEGLFYNGFWVVNDLETGYVETEGRVFIYNSENDDCPEVVNTYCNNIIIKIRFPLGRLPPTIGTSGKGETGNTTPTYIWRPADHLLHLCCAIWNL